VGEWRMTGILKIITLVLSLFMKIMERIDKKELEKAAINKEQLHELEVANNAIKTAINLRRNARRNFKRAGMPNNYKYYRRK